MEQPSIKQKALKGFFWSFIERFGTLFILFLSNVILARLLSPSDYGLIGMMTVFITLSNILIDGGLGSALIQRKNPTNKDYSTIFFLNIFIATICYLLIYFSAKSIGSFYNQSQLELLLKVLGVVLIIDAFSTIQNNILIKKLNFKRITIIKISSASTSVIISIILAYKGYGVWSLVVQSLTNSLIRSILLWWFTNWYPIWCFSIESFKSLFNFSSKLLLASLLSEGYRNLQLLIIGKFFPAKEVGYFTQAKQLENVPVSSLIAIINQVTYPIFSQIQDNPKELINKLRRCFKLLAFINFPLMILLTIIAPSLFLFLYSEKWLPAVPYFQWLCVGFGLLLVIHNTNLNALKAIGRSDIVLYLEIAKKILGITFIFAFMKFGVIGILWALTLNSIIEFFINSYFTGKYLSYGTKQQIKDILPILLYASLTGIIVHSISYVVSFNGIILMLIQTIIYIILYFLGSYILKFEIANYIFNEFLKKYTYAKANKRKD